MSDPAGTENAETTIEDATSGIVLIGTGDAAADAGECADGVCYL